MDDTETGQGLQDTSSTIASSRRRGTMYQRAEWRHDREPESGTANPPARNEQTAAVAATPPRAVDLSPTEAGREVVENANPVAAPPVSVDAPPPVVVRLPPPRPTSARARHLRSSRRKRSSLAVPSILLVAALLIVVSLLWPSSTTAPGDSGVAPPAGQPQPAAVTGQPGAAVPERVPAVSQATNDAPPPAPASRPEPPPEPRTPPAAAASPAPPVPVPVPAGPPAATLVAAQSPAAPLATVGQIRVTSNPAGARVTVNGIGWGQTPVTIPNLTLGPHTVRLTSDGYRSVQQTVQVTGDQPSATVRVTLRPAGQS